MASNSRAAQEQLSALEKANAPFEDQLYEAAKFIGIEISQLCVGLDYASHRSERSKATVYHGREEWLLRWLLKKMQVAEDGVPRKNPTSWLLLNFLLHAIPLSNAARILSERQFLPILRRTLDEATKVAAGSVETTSSSDSTVANTEVPRKASKKRKRSGVLVELVELVATSNVQPGKLPTLMDAIFVTMEYMVQSTKLAPETFEEGRGAAFSAEYMKNVIRTTASQSAVILSSWLSLCFTVEQSKSYPISRDSMNWLLPFIEVWETRLADDDSQMQFSLSCTRPTLSLLRALKDGNTPNITWASQLEELIARNIMIPAKAAAADNAESDLLKTLTRLSVLQDTSNAPLLFEIAIRSIQVHGSKRRRTNDDGWLQTVFSILKDSMSDRTEIQNGKQICSMLQSAIDYKLGLDLSSLRSITSKFALPEGREDWKLLATIIKLDANVFLIADGEKDLLQALLERITKASATQLWPDISEEVVSGVLVPLVREFAQARDLSGFLRHWFSQFVEFEALQKDAQSLVHHFSAWEDVALHKELGELLEASLTVQQITQILDWLASQATESPAAVCIILEGISGAVSREDVVDSVGLRLYHMMFDSEAAESLHVKYKWRPWRALSQTLSWSTAHNVDEIARLWGEGAEPFNSLLDCFKPGSPLPSQHDDMVDVNILETFRFVCTAWTVGQKGSRMEQLAKPVVLSFLGKLAVFFKLFSSEIEAGMKVNQEPGASGDDVSYKGIGCIALSFAQCIFIEYPMVLELGLNLKGVFREMLRNISWICSANLQGTSRSSALNWLKQNQEAFSDLWTPLFNCDSVLNHKELLETIVEILLSSDTDTESHGAPFPTTDAFTVKALLQVPAGLVFKSSREQILRGSFLTAQHDSDDTDRSLYKSTVLDPAVLSLKIKMMARPMVYEGMKFQEFINLADTLAESDIQRPQVNLALLKELVRLTVNFVHTNPDQSRNSTYISEAYKLIQKRVDKAILKKKHQLKYALVAVFDVTLTAFHSKAKALDDLGIIQGDKLENLTMAFQKCLVEQLGGLVVHEPKLLDESNTPEHIQRSMYLLILSIIDALSALGVDSKLLAEIAENLKAFAATVVETELNVGQRLRVFMAKHGPKAIEEDTEISLTGDVSDFYSRQLIIERARAGAVGLNNKQKLEYLNNIFGTSLSRPDNLDRLLCARTIIEMIDDVSQSSKEKGTKDTEEFDLTEAYSILCGQLWKSSGVRQFCIIAETMQLMLRTKPRSISQFNIDMTLGAISIICSRNGPCLNELRAGTIYSHMCWLLQAGLTHHRTKLQGHLHLVVQVMQSLLRCLFTPLPHSSTKADKTFGAPPPWLASRRNGLKARHAATYTRLVLMICDPTVSAVRGAQQNNLTSAKDKAKRMAGIHMQYVLISYIKLQLEMKMLPEIREKMVPGLYAIFDTTTPESRRMVSDSLDSSGRAIFGTLYKDWQRFGKWGGS